MSQPHQPAWIFDWRSIIFLASLLYISLIRIDKIQNDLESIAENGYNLPHYI